MLTVIIQIWAAEDKYTRIWLLFHVQTINAIIMGTDNSLMPFVYGRSNSAIVMTSISVRYSRFRCSIASKSTVLDLQHDETISSNTVRTHLHEHLALWLSASLTNVSFFMSLSSPLFGSQMTINKKTFEFHLTFQHIGCIGWMLKLKGFKLLQRQILLMFGSLNNFTF